jgi:hypothetical protein
MSDMDNIPKQMELLFDVVNLPHKAEVISFCARKESILSANAAVSNIRKPTEDEILKRVLERADRLAWYK